MPRKEFSKAVKVAATKRATRDGVTYCEGCGLPAKRWHYDHDNPDGLTGQPTLENCKLLCLPCHEAKTKQDVASIAKAKRREARNLGIRKAPTLKGQGFAKAPEQRRASKPMMKPMPERRPLYE
jgi:5-methylcytosine-specific restriction endonuclease McrA